MSKNENTHDLAARLNECCKMLGGAGIMAQASGIPKRTLDSYLYSGVEPKWSNLKAIGDAAGVSFDWLVAGRGTPMGISTSNSSASNDAAIDAEYAFISGYDIQVSAGPGRIADSEGISWKQAFRRNWLKIKGLSEKDLVVVFAKGDSMEPTISDNNIIMVDTSDKVPQDGRMYVIRVDGQLVVKRTSLAPGQGFLLISDNKDYPPHLVKFDGSNPDLEVVGRVVWVGKDY